MKISMLGVLAFVALSGCGSTSDGASSGNDGTLATMGMLGVPSPTLVGQNVMLVDAELNGHAGGRLLVDTGSPLTFVNAASFPGAMLPAQTQVNVDIGIGALTIDDVPSIQTTGGAMDQLHLAGILGGNVLRQFLTTFNYRDREFSIGAGASPRDVLPPTQISFKLSGGGLGTLNGSVIPFLPTRVPLSVSVEGTPHMFVLDTGASDVTLRTSVFEALVADGRGVLEDMVVSTVAGPATARVARCRTISVGDQSVANLPVMTFADTILDTISTEMHVQVDGLLGGDFLREFLVTIDYRGGKVELRRYASRDHVVDEFKRVGLWLAASGANAFVVSSVRRGGGADKLGIQAGDQVVSVDGQPLAGLDLFAVDALLNGPVGGSHRLGLGQTHDAALTQTEVTVPVDDLVPTPM